MGLSITYTMRKSFINVKAPIQLKSAFYVSDAGWLTQDRKIRGDFRALARKGGKHVIFILENAMTIYFFVGIGGLENSPASDWERKRSSQHRVEQ